MVENSFFFPSLSLLLMNLKNHYLNLIIYAKTNQNLDVKTNVWHVINLIFAGFFFFFFPCAEYEKSNRLSSHLTMNSAFFALISNKKNTFGLSFSKT